MRESSFLPEDGKNVYKCSLIMERNMKNDEI